MSNEENIRRNGDVNDDILSDIPKVDDFEDITTYPEEEGYDISKYSKNSQNGERLRTDRPSSAKPSQRSTVNNRVGGANKRRKRKKNGCLNKLIYLAVVLIVSIFLSIFAVNVVSDVFGIFQNDGVCTVKIPKDATPSQAADALYKSGVVEYKWAFNIFQKLKHVQKYEGGEYNLQYKTDYSTIIRKLRNPVQQEVVKVTIPEGYSLEQTLAKLQEEGVCSAADMKAQMNEITGDYKFLRSMSTNPDILYRFEGYLFPDTYEFYKNSTPDQVYKKFLSTLDAKLTDVMYQRADELGMSMNEVLTLASIIQKESSDTEEMENVSAVFHNRLKSASLRRLQSDVTVWYPYNTKDDVPKDLVANFSSKYNTYSIEGLPPGPICNPGLAAIEAVLYPAENDYYYFVTDANGKYYYATTFDQHERNCAEALKSGTIGGVDTME